MSYERRCDDDVATQRAGEGFAEVLRPGDVVLLSGPLGAGKTTFCKGVARALGVRERVTSPTFTMVRQHEAHNDVGITTLHHCDVYRVSSPGEIRDLDLGELVEEGGVALIEWGELAASVFGRDVVTVDFEVGGDESRVLRVTPARHEQRPALAAWAARTAT